MPACIYAAPRTDRRGPSRIHMRSGSPFAQGFDPSAAAGTEENRRSQHLEIKMPVYHAYIVGLHGRSIRAVQMDCTDDASAIKSAGRLVDDGHDVELWQTDRPIARFDTPSKQLFEK